jgi:hypothetical protein
LEAIDRNSDASEAKSGKSNNVKSTGKNGDGRISTEDLVKMLEDAKKKEESESVNDKNASNREAGNRKANAKSRTKATHNASSGRIGDHASGGSSRKKEHLKNRNHKAKINSASSFVQTGKESTKSPSGDPPVVPNHQVGSQLGSTQRFVVAPAGSAELEISELPDSVNLSHAPVVKSSWRKRRKRAQHAASRHAYAFATQGAGSNSRSENSKSISPESVVQIQQEREEKREKNSENNNVAGVSDSENNSESSNLIRASADSPKPMGTVSALEKEKSVTTKKKSKLLQRERRESDRRESDGDDTGTPPGDAPADPGQQKRDKDGNALNPDGTKKDPLESGDADIDEDDKCAKEHKDDGTWALW